MFSAKLSLFLLYLHLFRPNRRMRILIYLGIAFSFCLYFTNVPLNGILCSPRKGQQFSSQAVGEQCYRTLPFAIVQGTLNVLLDFYLPIPVVWALQLPLNKKIGIIAIFMTGFA